MRVWIDCTPLTRTRTGVGCYVYHLLKYLPVLEQKHEFLCYPYRLAIRSSLDWSRIQPQLDRRIRYRIPNRLRCLFWGTPWSRLGRSTGSGAPDVYHFTNYLCTRVKRKAAIVTIYDLSLVRYPEFHPATRRYYMAAQRLGWSLREAAQVIAISEFTKQEVVNVFQILPDKVKVVHLGVSPHFRPVLIGAQEKQTVQQLGIRLPFILSVGTLEPRKNYIRLLQCFERAKERLKVPHQLVIVGARGWMYEEIFQTAGTLKHKDDFLFLDYVREDLLPLLMSAAELFIYPSIYEGFGLPPLEAISCGAPTILSTTCPIFQHIGQATLGMNPIDVEDMTNQLCRLLTDPDLRCALSQRGRQQAAGFSWLETARKTVRIYEQVKQQDDGHDL